MCTLIYRMKDTEFVHVSKSYVPSREYLLEEFEKWLMDHFGVNAHPSDEPLMIFSAEWDSICFDMKDGTRISYSCDGTFGHHTVTGVTFGSDVVEAEEGMSLMRDVASLHDLEFDWRGHDMIMTSKKTFCLNRQFTLTPVKVRGWLEFEVHGANPFVPYTPFPNDASA